LVPHLPIGNNLAAVPVKMVEFMALGLPIVFSDLPNHHELPGSSGAGIAVDPIRPEQIADAVERLIKNPELARRMGEAGRRAVHERLNWRIESLKMFDLYHEILGPRSPEGPVRDGRSLACVSG